MPGYQPTPLLDATETARRLGVGKLLVKDESTRLGLPAFKILGASWAINCALARVAQCEPPSTFDDLRALVSRRPSSSMVTASDGNHGRAVARMARLLELKATVYLPAGTAAARIRAIESEGARVRVVDGTYDDAVRCAALDEGPDCLLISDTSWPGYESVPMALTAGYDTMLCEVDDQLASDDLAEPDVVFVQVGVGALAAAVCGHRWTSQPSIVGVEPDDAACLLESLASDSPASVAGPHRSIMAGLNCGTLSMIAWPILRGAITVSLTVQDEVTRDAMRLLAEDGVLAGESGAAGLSGLLALLGCPCLEEPFEQLGIGPDSTVLVIVTEGVTDPAGYDASVSGRRLWCPPVGGVRRS